MGKKGFDLLIQGYGFLRPGGIYIAGPPAMAGIPRQSELRDQQQAASRIQQRQVADPPPVFKDAQMQQLFGNIGCIFRGIPRFRLLIMELSCAVSETIKVRRMTATPSGEVWALISEI